MLVTSTIVSSPKHKTQQSKQQQQQQTTTGGKKETMNRHNNNIMIVLLLAVLQVLAQNIFGVFGDQEEADVCRFTTTEITSDGSAVTRFLEFEPGENVGDVFETRCGSSEDYPCFCAPTLDRQVYCPYCGFVNETNDLHCAADGETITFPDGSVNRQCSCEFNEDDPSAEPIRNCTVVDDNVEIDPQCVLADENGNDVVFDAGDPIPFFPGACGEPAEWPTFCLGTVRDDAVGGILFEYPYCVFSNTADGSTICAKDGGTVLFIDVLDDSLTCTCSYTTADGPQTDCVRGSPSGPPTTSPPGSTPTAAPLPPASAYTLRMDSMVYVALLLSVVSHLFL